MKRLIRAAFVCAFVAVAALLPSAQAGPLTPLKYHEIVVGPLSFDAGGTTVFLLGYDSISPEGHSTLVHGSIGPEPFAAALALFNYDPNAATAHFSLHGFVGQSAEELLAEIHVVYNRDGSVHTLEVFGTLGGEPFSVPPIVLPIPLPLA